jgi:hypothetical protein
MIKSTITKISIFIAFVLVSGVFTIGGSVYAQQNSTTATPPHQMQMTTAGSDNGTVTRDAVTVLLEGHHVPKGDFIHLYDATPYQIVTGHVAAKLPCNSDSVATANILIGQAPKLSKADPEFISELSTPGNQCLYHVDLMSNSTNPITDIAIQNNSTNDITFPPTSTVVIGVDKIAPLPEGAEEHH